MRAGVLAVAAIGLAGAVGATNAAADEAPYVDTPSLLPPTAIGYQPSKEKDCADGSKSCIDRTVAEMWRRFHRVVPRCDHRAVFSLTYLRVTEDVRDADRQGFFDDSKWLQQEDAVFARLYFEAYDNYAAGRRDKVPESWRIEFDSARDRTVSALGDLLLSMNAHINRDMPFVLAGIGIVNPDGGTTHKPDHDRYNKRLAKLYGPVIHEIADRFDPTTDDVDVGFADEEFAVQVLQDWREGVWRNAERLHAAKTDAERAQVAQSIEDYANAQAQFILAATRYGPGQDSQARDAWCAVHGGQDPKYGTGAGVAKLKLRKSGVRRDGGDAPVALVCPGDEGDCRGAVTLWAKRPRRHPIWLGRRSFSMQPGSEQTLRIGLGSRALELLDGSHRLPVRVTLRRYGVAPKRKVTHRGSALAD